MQHTTTFPARFHLALVAACLLLADYLPAWHKPWFVAESGHFGGGSTLTFLLVLGLFLRWRPALGLTYILLALQLMVAGYILSCNIPTGGPTFGFLAVSCLRLLAGFLVYCSAPIKQYLSQQPAEAHS